MSRPAGLAALALLLSAGSTLALAGEPDRARIAVVELPSDAIPGGTTMAVVEVSNAGDREWPASGPVRLAYHWLDESGRLVERDGVRTALPQAVAPGATVRLCAQLVAPAAPGTYTIEWDLVREGVHWFSEVDTASVARDAVRVARPAPKWAALMRTLAWMLVTFGHVVAVAAMARRALPHSSADEVFFTATLLGVGGLLSVLAAIASTTGLSLGRAAFGLAAVDALSIAWVFRPTLRGPTPVTRARRLTAAEWAGTAVIVAVATHWTGVAAASARVTGTDAAHYHLPHAVNFALGASPWGLTATPHLYPMGTSLLAAWFLLPLEAPLLVDLTLLPMFLLLVAALGWLFRIATGQSGLAWVTWFSLLLFSTPLLRLASLPSADLTYAAGFVALLAALLAAWTRRSLTGLDLALVGLACGVLVGAKAAGVPAAALVFGIVGAAWLLRDLVARDGAARYSIRPFDVVVAAALLVLSGGFWLMRSWVNYGSPVAPVGIRVLGITLVPGGAWNESQLYLSVLKDLQDPSYNLPARTATFVRQWLGPFYLPALLVSLVIPLELVVWRVRRRTREPWVSARWVLWLAVVAAGVPLVWLLVHAPWTSLEWTGGLSLRFALPIVVLLPLLSLIAVFTPLAPWYERPLARTLALGLFAATSLVVFLTHQHTPGLPDAESVPGLDLVALLVSGGFLAVVTTASRFPTRRVWMPAVAIVGIAASVATRRVVVVNEVLSSADHAALRRLETCGPGEPAAGPDRFRATFLEARRFEASAGRTCQKRRFFVISRFDQPLALQPVPYSSLVFDARGSRLIEREARRAAPGEKPDWCDYVIVRKDERDVHPAADLLVRLRGRGLVEPVGEAAPYLVFSVQAKPDRR